MSDASRIAQRYLDRVPGLLKTAMVFDTEAARKKYLEDHPKANKAKHTVKDQAKDTKPDDKGEADKPTKEEGKNKGTKPKGPATSKRFYSKKHDMTLEGVTEEEFESFINDPVGRELTERYNLKAIAGSDGILSRKDLDNALFVRDGLKKVMDEGGEQDFCKLHKEKCEKNMGVERDSMPQFTSKPIKDMLAAVPDDRFEEIQKGLKNKSLSLNDIEDDERERYFERMNAMSAVEAGADPKSTKSTFDAFADSLREAGVKIGPVKGGVPAKELHATQSEINTKATFRNADKLLRTGKLEGGAIYISSDNHILDGHHRWSGVLTATPDTPMEVIRIDKTMDELLDLSHKAPGVFRQDFRFRVVDDDKPIDIARKPGSTWKQRNDKWYGKASNGDLGGPFDDEKASKAFAKGGKKTASEDTMNTQLRSDLLRIATELPKGDETRRQILASLQKEANPGWELVMEILGDDYRGLVLARRNLSGASEHSTRVADLLAESLDALSKKLNVDRNTMAAINKLRNFSNNADRWDIDMQANQIMKIADLLDIRVHNTLMASGPEQD